MHTLKQILDNAASENRFSLLEHEVYEFLGAAGCNVPRYLFLLPGETPTAEAVSSLEKEDVFLKVVSTAIAHKTDVGGVKRVKATPQAIQAAMEEMLSGIPARYVDWIHAHPAIVPEEYRDLEAVALKKEIASTITGFIVVEAIHGEGKGPGSELLAGLRHNREFGPVLTMGVGGIDTELLGVACRKGLAVVTASAVLSTPEEMLSQLRPTLAYRRLSGRTRLGGVLVSDEELLGTIKAFQSIAAELGSDGNAGVGPARWVVTELEVNPFVACAGKLVAVDGLLKFRKAESLPSARPADSIKALLNPKSIAVIGVSTKGSNMGRIILRNVLQVGFNPERVWVVHPGAPEIDGVKCVPTIQALPERVDVFVLAVNAEQVPEVIEELVEYDKAVGVILIAGGMGEKEGGQSLEQRVKSSIVKAREERKPLVVNGGNSLGIVSAPGNYHTLFIPQNKLPLKKGGKGNVAFLSQSGAYMISRMSKLDWISPRFAISTGNQADLTIADYLHYLADDPVLQTYAVYVEGFKDADGLSFARAIRKVRAHGKDVIFYKAGRTAEGKSATSGHTASLAGEYDVCESIVENAGGLVARTFNEYLNLLKVSSLMGHKKWGGRGLAAMSNAGYESVGIADSVRGEGWNLTLTRFAPTTQESLRKALAEGRVDSLVDVRNPLDITPMADDSAHEKIVRSFLSDPGVDMVLCASVPLTPAMATLAQGVPEEQSIRAKGSLVNRLARIMTETDKPLVACIDSGILFDPMAAALEEKGIPTFRSADQAVNTLGRFVESKV